MSIRYYIIAIVLLTPALASAQTTHVDDVHHYRMEVPAGWVQSPADLVASLNEDMDKRLPNRDFDFIAHFAPLNADWNSPYLLVQFTRVPLAGNTYEQIEQQFGARSWESDVRRELESAAPDVLSDFDFSTATLDRTSNRMFMDIDVALPGGSRRKGRCVLNLAAHGVVQLNFYSSPETFEENLPHLHAFLAGFELDPEYTFRPAAGTMSATGSRPGADWSAIASRVAAVALAGGIAGAVIGFVSKKKPARESE